MDEAVAAFNTFIDEQKKLEGKAKVTLIAFDDRYEVVLVRVKLKDVKPLTVNAVLPRGTALNDAIGKAINSVSSKRKDVVLLIQTDGGENSSREFKTSQVNEMIKAKEQLGWDVTFIGAGIDAFDVGMNYGIKRGNIMAVT